MTTMQAEIIKDSVGPSSKRITTFQLRYPRFIHAEFMTHRMFSRNASSSRAVPVARMIADVEADPVVPLFWGKNQPGMQAREELSSTPRDFCWLEWNTAMHAAINAAYKMARIGAHKQIINRILEPYSHINVVCTATEWDNFFALRMHEDAEPHINLLATIMHQAMRDSTPQPLQAGEWHLPYVDKDMPLETALKVSTSRCARVSYMTHDQQPSTVEKDVALAEKLMAQVPMHASPMEHQAMAWRVDQQFSNFRGFQSYRNRLEWSGLA